MKRFLIASALLHVNISSSDLRISYKSNMPGRKGSFRNYSEDAMTSAIEDVRLHQTPIRTAAKKFKVPRTTLKYKVEGKSPIGRKMGPNSILTKEEEAEICRWIVKMGQTGFPVTVDQLTVSVEKFLKEMKRSNPFKDDRPGRTWVKGFLRRNPSVSKRISQNLTISRASVTEQQILNWFSEVFTYLKKHDYENILDDPSRIFNCDETAFFLNPKGAKVLAKKGGKNVYQQINANEKECVTVLITGSASGVLGPTTVLFKYKRVPQDIVENFPEEWGLGKTDSGWMTCEAFFEFISNIFSPWLVKTKVTLPVILFVDGHVSHLCLQTSQFCERNGIILVALYPNATHLLQPMDVAVFKTLKEGWKRRVQQWRIENLKKEESPLLKKRDFAKLLRELLEKNVTKSVLSNGFRKCGLCPWNPQEVKVPGQEIENEQECVSKELRVKYLKEGLRFLNENMDTAKLDSFQSSFNTGDTWSGDLLDTSLFMLWKKTKMELDQLTLCAESCANADIETGTELNEVEEPSFNDIASTQVQAVGLYDRLLSAEQIQKEGPAVIADLPMNLASSTTSEELESSAMNICSRRTSREVSLSFLGTDTPEFLQPLSSESKALQRSPVAGPSHAPDVLQPLFMENRTPQKSSVAGDGIPSPFKRHFYYSSIIKTQKKRAPKDKMPTIVSGKLCQEYFEKKLKNKEELERLKTERAHERKRKREEKEKAKQKKGKHPKDKRIKRQLNFSESSDSSAEVSSGETVWVKSSKNEEEHEGHCWKPIRKCIDEFVVIKCNDKYFPGKILNVAETEATVSSMEKIGRLWKWPKRPDILNYQWDSVVSHIEEPKKVSKTRNVFSVPELEFAWK